MSMGSSLLARSFVWLGSSSTLITGQMFAAVLRGLRPSEAFLQLPQLRCPTELSSQATRRDLSIQAHLRQKRQAEAAFLVLESLRYMYYNSASTQLEWYVGGAQVRHSRRDGSRPAGKRGDPVPWLRPWSSTAAEERCTEPGISAQEEPSRLQPSGSSATSEGGMP